MATEYDELPAPVLKGVQAFADVNVTWLSKQLAAAGIGSPRSVEARARAIYTAVAGAQMISRSRSDITVFDALIESYRAAGLLRG
jgi:TetR/AcrR family transcriptional repressor of nem operon